LSRHRENLRETFPQAGFDTAPRMTEPAPSMMKSLQWRLECLAQGAVEGVASMLPVGLAYRLGSAIGGLLWHLLPKRRAIVLRNLRIAMAGDASREEIEAIGRESFRRVAGNLVAAAKTAQLTAEEMAEVVRIENQHLFDEAMVAGRGVVVQIPHMGNWEVLARLQLLLPEGAKLGAFYRPLNNPLMDKRVLQRRSADGTRMFSKHDGPLQAVGFLRDNGALGILSDQRTGIAGEPAAFFGRWTRCSPLPSILARRVKCPVLAVSMETIKPGRWVLSFQSVTPPFHVQDCMDTLEKVMRVSPADVFWFQDRWRVSAKQGLHEWLGDKPVSSGKPHRALLWDGTPDSLPSEWRHPDVIHETAEHKDHGNLTEQLRAIDSKRPLPIDFILARAPSRELIRAAKALGIPVFPLA
jgi:KDO2-lipid IV(A) lauroyltransferase